MLQPHEEVVYPGRVISRIVDFCSAMSGLDAFGMRMNWPFAKWRPSADFNAPSTTEMMENFSAFVLVIDSPALRDLQSVLKYSQAASVSPFA